MTDRPTPNPDGRQTTKTMDIFPDPDGRYTVPAEGDVIASENSGAIYIIEHARRVGYKGGSPNWAGVDDDGWHYWLEDGHRFYRFKLTLTRQLPDAGWKPDWYFENRKRS